MGEKTVKRRAPYALRACNACRRRKGKCDGCQPCGYCKSRGQACRFAAGGGLVDEWRDVPVVLNTADDEANTQPLGTINPSPSSTSQETSLLEMVSNLQNQVNNLASRVHMSNESNSRTSPWSFPLSKSANEDRLSEGPAETTPNSEPGRGFYGPTSPDFSLNMAQMNMRQRSFSETSPHRPQLASIDDEPESDNEGSPRASDGSIAHGYNPWPSHGEQGYRSRLLRFKSLLGLKDVLRLLMVYQEVVGDFHPIVDLGHLIKRTRAWYNDTAPDSCDGSVGSIDSDSDEDDLLVLNLALAIALNTEYESMSLSPEILLQASFQDAVNARLVCPQPSIKHATIVLLGGIYYFFQDMPRSSWRMCGIAGRMLMEMGFHNGDILDHILDSEEKRSAASTIMSSILVLDRQWSSATGLPSNFKNSSFDSIKKSLIKTPYLKAMLAFILISDKFSEPLSRAAKGEKYDDSDAFEVMNFQVDQWRTKVIDEESRRQIEAWQAGGSVRPPSWAILLTLRAQSVRCMILRPCFFSESDVEAAGKRHLRPAMDLVSNVVNVLWTLDATTDIYRKQHPYYQHFLASVCALLFLMVSYVEQHRAQLAASLPPDFADFMGETFRKALYLAEVHARSRASRKLLKRLLEMRNALTKLGMLPTTNNQPGGGRQPAQQPAISNTKAPRSKTPSSRPDTQDLLSGTLMDYSEPFDLMAIDPQLEAGLTTTLDDDFQLGSAESLLFQWPLNEDSGFFLDAGF